MNETNNTQLINNVREYFASKMIDDAMDSRIGVELEFPIAKLDGSIIDLKIIKNLIMFIIEELNFLVIETDADGMPIKMQHQQTKDILSFEYCYAVLELSLAPATSLIDIDDTFQVYFRNIQHYLVKHGYHLVCMGTNPYEWIKEIPILKTDFHHIASGHLRKSNNSKYNMNEIIPSAITSSHLHISLTEKDFIDSLNIINKLELVKTKLFYNSCLFGNKINYSKSCFIREDFWKNSNFILGKNSSPILNLSFKSMADYCNLFIQTTPVLYVKRNGKYVSIEKMSVAKYFNSDFVVGRIVDNQIESSQIIKIQPEFSDIQYFKSYFYNRLTHFGTLEIRSACQQPVGSLFAPAAFNLGLIYNRVKINKFLQRCNYKALLGTSNNKLFIKLYDLVRDGLIMRGFGEEKYIDCLYDRVVDRTNPAKSSIHLLNKKNYSIKDVVWQFSNSEV